MCLSDVPIILQKFVILTNMHDTAWVLSMLKMKLLFYCDLKLVQLASFDKKILPLESIILNMLLINLDSQSHLYGEIILKCQHV